LKRTSGTSRRALRARIVFRCRSPLNPVLDGHG
jgi:hypothetical protein